MKANKLAVAPAAAISFDEFIFQERNHLYGAYELRKEYKKRLLVALFFMSIILATAISMPYILKWIEGTTVAKPKLNKVATVIEITKFDDVVPPAPPAPEPPKDFLKKLLNPIFEVVDTTKDKNDEPIVMLTPEEIGSDTGTKGDYTPIPEVKDPVIPVDSTYTFVQEQATFEGGNINNFGKWVGQNINVDRISESNLDGRVFLQFVIDKTGNITNLRVTRSFNKEVDKEILRTIGNSPKKWTPGKQNGTPVKQLISMSILVKIQG